MSDPETKLDIARRITAAVERGLLASDGVPVPPMAP
jgi:hypothetical protein